MYELSNIEVNSVDGGWGWVYRFGRFLAQSAVGEAITQGGYALAGEVGGAGGYDVGGYGGDYYSNLPPGVQ